MLHNMGALIELPDGRRGRIVYNGLDGQGINLSEKPLALEDREILLGTCPLFEEQQPENFPSYLVPKVMLRNKYTDEIECVEEYKIIQESEADNGQA